MKNETNLDEFINNGGGLVNNWFITINQTDKGDS